MLEQEEFHRVGNHGDEQALLIASGQLFGVGGWNALDAENAVSDLIRIHRIFLRLMSALA
jgi:hypothetical protein